MRTCSILGEDHKREARDSSTDRLSVEDGTGKAHMGLRFVRAVSPAWRGPPPVEKPRGCPRAEGLSCTSPELQATLETRVLVAQGICREGGWFLQCFRVGTVIVRNMFDAVGRND